MVFGYQEPESEVHLLSSVRPFVTSFACHTLLLTILSGYNIVQILYIVHITWFMQHTYHLSDSLKETVTEVTHKQILELFN